MPDNPIPDELRSEHLFLLVGTNPLPDWVAAKLLLRDGGQLYLIHSNTTAEVAKRIARFMLHRGYRQPIYVRVENPYQPHSVRTALEERIRQLQSDSIGLNYTGGTKVMSVHSYRVFTQWQPNKIIFSYLEAPRHVMHFEPIPPKHERSSEYSVGMVEDVKCTLEELFSLHEDFTVGSPAKRVKAKAAADLLIDVHDTQNSQAAWRQECDKLLKTRGRFKPEAELKKQPIPLDAKLPKLAEALMPGGTTGTKTLGDVVTQAGSEFTNATELAAWLDGQWLEHLVLACLRQRDNDYQVHSYGRNIKPRVGGIGFELDVAAMRGYQLHAISCYSGSTNGTCKQKLFEVFTRARQLGGDEARAALVCCSDDPRRVRDEVGQMWDVIDRVEVFGRADLKRLADRLQAWFDTGAK